MTKRLVIMTWVDSGQPTTHWQWLSAYQPLKAIKCVSVGWLIQDDDEVKVLAQSFGDIDRDGDDIQAMGLIKIPAACVLTTEILEERPAETEAAA